MTNNISLQNPLRRLLFLVLLLTASWSWSEPQIEASRSIALPAVDGSVVTLADYSGQVVLLDFWASWCGPCRESFPWMNELQSKYGAQGFKVVAVNLDQDPHLARKFLSKYPANFTVLLDSKAQLPPLFEVMGMPTSYLLDRNGNVHATHIGFQNNETAEYEQQLIKLLSEQ
jgi:thiol-disulfide isomerase/thioredoxin